MTVAETADYIEDVTKAKVEWAWQIALFQRLDKFPKLDELWPKPNTAAVSSDESILAHFKAMKAAKDREKFLADRGIVPVILREIDKPS